jgi:AcrR family transcriptional regulator
MNATSARTRASASDALAPKRQRAKRMPADARKAVILREAGGFFARNGFAASTRDLADQIGVRQALLYKYYPSKEALIEAVFDRILNERTTGGGGRLNADQSTSLTDRILRFYETMAALADGSGTRLASRAALEDLPVTARLAAFLARNLFMPVLDELRTVEGLPSLANRTLMRGEFEIMAFHAGAMFANLRRGLDNLPAPEDTEAFMRLYVSTFIAGARHAMRELHSGAGAAAMTADADIPSDKPATRPTA